MLLCCYVVLLLTHSVVFWLFCQSSVGPPAFRCSANVSCSVVPGFSVPESSTCHFKELILSRYSYYLALVKCTSCFSHPWVQKIRIAYYPFHFQLLIVISYFLWVKDLKNTFETTWAAMYMKCIKLLCWLAQRI